MKTFLEEGFNTYQYQVCQDSIITAMFSDEEQMDIADEFTETSANSAIRSFCKAPIATSAKKLTNGFTSYEAIKSLHVKAAASKKRTIPKTDSRQCTFEPHVNRNRSGSKQRKRSFKKFVEDQNTYVAAKQAKLLQKRQQKAKNQVNELTCRPTIDRNSQRILSDLSRTNQLKNEVFDRLSRQKQITVSVQQQTLFSPKILAKSRQLSKNRKQNVSDLLYSDAQRRIEKERFLNSSVNSRKQTNPSINKNASKYTSKKVHNEFIELVDENESVVSPIVAVSIISELFNVDLNPNQSEHKQETCTKVLGYLMESVEDKTVNVDRLWNFIQVILNCNSSTKFYSQSQQESISAQFSFFYINRLAKERKQKTPERLSFQPQTLTKSTKMAGRHRQRVLTEINEFISNQNVTVNQNEEMKIEDLFIAEYMKRQLSNENKKREKQNMQLQQCSFRPSINKNVKKGKALKINVKIMRKITQQETQSILLNNSKQMYESDISRTLVNSESQNIRINKLSKSKLPPQAPPVVKDMQKTVLRMSLGRKNRQLSQQYHSRGYPKNVQNWDSYRRKQKQNFEGQGGFH